MTVPVESVRQGILEDVQATIQGMRRGLGYWFEPRPTSVEIGERDLLQVPPEVMPYYQVTPDDRRAEREFLPFGRLRITMAILITALAEAEGARGDQKFRTAERLAADLEKALRVDLTRGGRAVLTRVLEPDPPFVGTGNDRRVIQAQSVEVVIDRRFGTP